MNFICNIFIPWRFYLTPPKVLFCFFPKLYPSHVCALYLFFVWPKAFSTPLCLVHHVFHSSLSVCLQGLLITRYPLYGCYSSIILFMAHLLILLLFFFYLFLPLSTFPIINAPFTLSAHFIVICLFHSSSCISIHLPRQHIFCLLWTCPSQSNLFLFWPLIH